MKVAFFPRSTTPTARTIVMARSLLGFADGFVSVLLADYLLRIGFTPLQVGTIITGTLLGSATLTLAVGLQGHRFGVQRLLVGAAALMLATGLGFWGITDFWPLLVVAFAGTLNPSGGDVSVFLPVEQAALAEEAAGRERTALFARYNLGGALLGALGALASGGPTRLADLFGWEQVTAQRAGFLLYAAVAIAIGIVYGTRRWQPRNQAPWVPPRRGLQRSRRIVLRLSALFSLDSIGGGFVVQSLLALWLFRRFELSVEAAGVIFFVAGVLSSFSQLVSAWLADRVGLINTMVYTHIPANILLILTAFMPSAPLAIALLLLRMALSQMDVPARQAYVMAVVPPEERAAAASVSNVPRSLVSALSPILAGALITTSNFGYPLILGGLLKIIYDLLLLYQFKSVRPEFEADARAQS